MEHLLSGISWAQFLAGTLLVLASFYSYLAYRYYPTEIRSLFQLKQPPGQNPFLFQQQNREPEPMAGQNQQNPETTAIPQEESTEDHMERIEELITRIKSAIARLTPEENPAALQARIKEILNHFPELKHSGFGPAIIELIQTEIKHSGAAPPTEQQLTGLWE